jgi:rhodanese-related sulfurtransferase
MSYINLNPQEFKDAIENKDNVVILDVRTPAEVAEGIIEGAVVVDLLAGDFAEKVKDFDKNKNYYIYCRSGGRSGQACQVMAGMDFPNLVNLSGGMLGWNS